MFTSSIQLNLVLLISLLLNFGLLSLVGILVWRRGGISYLRRKFSRPAPDYSPFYRHRQQQFELLKISADGIVFLGDSITHEGEWSEWFSSGKIHNRGIAGDTIAGVIDRLDVVLAPPPRQLFLMIGINDLLRDTSIETVISTYQQLLAAIRAKAPETTVFVQSILPIDPQLCPTALSNKAIAATNEKLQIVARDFSCHYIDLFPKFCDSQGRLDRQFTQDGLHLNGLAYQHWQQQISPHIYIGEQPM